MPLMGLEQRLVSCYIFRTMTSKPILQTPTREMHKERTLVIIKPDGVQRALIGDIISRFERTGLKFTAFKFLVPTEAQCLEHYHKDEAWFLKKGNRIIDDLTAQVAFGADGHRRRTAPCGMGRQVR